MRRIHMSSTDKLGSKLREIVGKANVIQDRSKLDTYSIDGKRPKVIVSPKTIEEVSKIVAYANQQQLAIIPRGNGTKLRMGRIPTKVDIVLSTLRLKKVTDNDCENLTLSAESGMTLKEVEKMLAKEGKGYFLPLDPFYTREATLGGIVATNSSGPKRLFYGTARDLIIGTKAVFPNGDIVVSGGKTVKNVSGYDMCKLLIGSYGTLGILCEMTFRLLPLPEKEATLLIPFAKLEEADAFVRQLIGSQLIPTAIETLNATALKKMKYPEPVSNGYYLVAIGLEGVGEGVERQVLDMSEIGKKYGGLKAEVLDPEQQKAFWTAFRDLSKGLAKNDPDSISLKSNFLISKCGEMVGSYEKMIKESGMDCAILSHSGNGVLYAYILRRKNSRPKSDSLVGLIGKLTDEAVKSGGNLVIESAPLTIKRKVDVWGKRRDDYPIMRRLKKEIDPAGILSPGRYVGGI
jgi:glycolate oxidase FAD binding subunit